MRGGQSASCICMCAESVFAVICGGDAVVQADAQADVQGSLPSRQRKRDKPNQWPWARTAAKLKLIDVKNRNPRQGRASPLTDVTGSGTYDGSIDGPEGPGTKN